MSESPWYDRLLVVLPESYRAGVFILSIVALGIFLCVRLIYGFDWDTALTSYYFGLPCSLAIMAGGIIFSVRRRRSLWSKYLFLDAGLVFSGMALGAHELWNYHEYRYQADYKFSRNTWNPYKAPDSFLEPMPGDSRKYLKKEAYAGRIEPVSDRPTGSLHLVISIQGGDDAGDMPGCHIIRSRLEFPGSGPLEPSATQELGSRFKDSAVHQWSLSKLRKNMICVVQVAIGKTANVECKPVLEVREE